MDTPSMRHGETRHQILVLLLKHGPITASELGARMNLSAAGVRRHLDALVDEELAEVVRRHKPAGRGRPSKYFRLTDQGRECFGHDYDSLANSALSTLRSIGGADAVRAFAEERIDSVIAEVAPAEGGEESVEATTRQLIEAFERHGYAPTASRVGRGIQLCQHHCPVASVAAEHPEICEAEIEAISRKVGLHIQPLALIADGHGICTTNIPLTGDGSSPSDQSSLSDQKHDERSES